MLFSTHITADLERAADYITYITRGTLYYTGPKDEFEDSFRVVKGDLREFDAVNAVAVGSRRYATGFDALVPIEQLGALVHDHDTLISEPPSIDDIMRLTNERPTSVNDRHRGELQ